MTKWLGKQTGQLANANAPKTLASGILGYQI
jgi:hypothetical protein